MQGAGRLRGDEHRALRAFREDYPSARAVLLHRSTERALTDGVLGLPVDDFLRRLRPGPLDAALADR